MILCLGINLLWNHGSLIVQHHDSRRVHHRVEGGVLIGEIALRLIPLIVGILGLLLRRVGVGILRWWHVDWHSDCKLLVGFFFSEVSVILFLHQKYIINSQHRLQIRIQH